MTWDDVVILSDQEVRGIYNDVYNGFWRKYKEPPDWQSPDWEKVVQQGYLLWERYESCPLAVHMIQDLMDQLETRSKRKGASE